MNPKIGLILGIHANNSAEFVVCSRVTSQWHFDNPKGIDDCMRKFRKLKNLDNEPAYTKIWWLDVEIPA